MVRSKANGRKKRRYVTSANRDSAGKLPDTHWAQAVSMLALTIRAAKLESKKQLPGDFPKTSDLEIIRVRALSSQI